MLLKYSHPAVKGISKYFDIAYFLRFVLLFVALYYFHIIFNGITSREGNYYSPFLDQYLNYIRWLTLSILKMAQLIIRLFGVDAYIEGSQVLKSASGLGVNLWLPCLGLGITSFWIAFIAFQAIPVTKKIYWCLSGICAIWFINCWRIALLLLSLENDWKANPYLDHHDIFNIAAYGVVIALIILCNRTEKRYES